jgi:hypothetical protein
MTDRIRMRILRGAGRPSQFFYFDDLPSRRLILATLDRETALEKAKGAG